MVEIVARTTVARPTDLRECKFNAESFSDVNVGPQGTSETEVQLRIRKFGPTIRSVV